MVLNESHHALKVCENKGADQLCIDSTADQLLCYHYTYEPRCEKTGLWGFRSGPTQTGLYSHGS